MERLKSTLTCSHCSKIFKDPIELPCKHNLCKRHLTEKSTTNKSKKMKCGDCKQDFEIIKDTDFKTIEIIKKQLDQLVYLSDEELALKNKIEDSIRQFFQFYEQFTLNKTNLAHNHFQEIRFKLDEHREELKQKIDDIYMEMIQKTKTFEVAYLKSLESKLKASLKSFEIKSLEQSLNETEESFRNPNLLLESIRGMNRQHEEAISELKSKLDALSKVKDELTGTNEFKPNLSFNQDSFGRLHLNEYSIDPFMSEILTGKQPFDLIKLCEFSLKDKWTLLYRGSIDGFGAADFHSRCDGHKNTLTIVKAHGSSYIFGGFTSVTWNGSYQYKSNPNTFLFSLTNKDNRPCKMKQINTIKSILCHSENGPTFGGGFDLHVCNDANTGAVSYSKLGHTYQHPQPSQDQSFLAGSHPFQLSEIEVYQKG